MPIQNECRILVTIQTNFFVLPNEANNGIYLPELDLPLDFFVVLKVKNCFEVQFQHKNIQINICVNKIGVNKGSNYYIELKIFESK